MPTTMRARHAVEPLVAPLEQRLDDGPGRERRGAVRELLGTAPIGRQASPGHLDGVALSLQVGDELVGFLVDGVLRWHRLEGVRRVGTRQAHHAVREGLEPERVARVLAAVRGDFGPGRCAPVDDRVEALLRVELGHGDGRGHDEGRATTDGDAVEEEDQARLAGPDLRALHEDGRHDRAHGGRLLRISLRYGVRLLS